MDYIAPEVAQGLEYDAKVDIWGAGCVAVALLTTKPPFSHHQSPMAVMAAITSGDFDLSGISSPLAQTFIKSCLVVDPKKRPSAEQLLKHQWLQATG
jgi:serine/threonine protein kinase